MGGEEGRRSAAPSFVVLSQRQLSLSPLPNPVPRLVPLQYKTAGTSAHWTVGGVANAKARHPLFGGRRRRCHRNGSPCSLLSNITRSTFVSCPALIGRPARAESTVRFVFDSRENGGRDAEARKLFWISILGHDREYGKRSEACIWHMLVCVMHIYRWPQYNEVGPVEGHTPLLYFGRGL